MEIDDYKFRKLKEFVEAELGFSITYYNDDYLKRRIKSRMRRQSCTDLDNYYQLLRSDSNEQELLLRSFSINVTGFFRNPDVWSCIRELMQKKSQEGTCRVWSAGCADGREAYSAALLALEDDLIDASNVEVFGSDINQEALDKADRGEYENTITNDVKEQLDFLDEPFRHVKEAGERVRVTEPVREMVTFENHDLIQDKPRRWFDVVLCRNVLIYLKRDHETDIFDTLTSAINEGGYIVIGKAETLPASLDSVFETVDPALRIYQYKGE